jgi:hypothetical protein
MMNRIHNPGIRRWRTAGFCLLGAGLLAALFVFRVRFDMEDFAVNHTAAHRMLVGETIYRIEDEHWQFKYMPAAALIYAPLTLIDRTPAMVVWFLITAGSCVGLAVLSRKLLPGELGRNRWAAWLPSLILLRFYLREIELGQINALVTLVLTLSILLSVRPSSAPCPRRRVMSGILWGAAVALKPYSLIFLPYFAVKGRWRSLLGGLGVLGAAFLAPALFFGWQGNLIVHGEWISTLSQSTPRLFTSQDNISLWALFAKWTGEGPAATGLAAGAVGALALLFLAVVIRGRGLDRAESLEGSLLLALVPLVSPLGWDYTLLMAAAGLTCLVWGFEDFPRWARWVLAVDFCIIGLSLYDIMGRSLYTAFMRLSVPTICFLIVAAALASMRFRRIL